jgi:aryl-alcohol dehydrogenase-like predicted oxidoreductase
MQQGLLGRTSLPVSRLGLGLAALGRPAYINLGHAEDLAGKTDAVRLERNIHAVVDAARAVGVRYLDAARSYGSAEQFVASWLERRGLQPGEVTVGSKWNPRRHGPGESAVATLRRQLGETRALLGGYLGLYQIHSLRLESGVLEDQAVLEELELLRDSGLAIGLSVRGPGQAEAIERALEVGRFDSVQATWNLLERSAGPALAEAHAAGLGVIVKEALANGRLTSRGDVAVLEEAAQERGTTPDALALAATLAQPWAGVVLSGAATVETLHSNLRALDVEYDQELDEQLAVLVEEPEAYWSARPRLRGD